MKCMLSFLECCYKDYETIAAGGGIVEGVFLKEWLIRFVRYKLLHLEWINNKIQLDSTRNYIQSSSINHMEKNIFKNNVPVCLAVF